MFNIVGQRSGFIKTIVIIVIALIILGYFGYNIEDIMKSPLVQKNLNYAWDLVQYVWNNYLKVPTMFVWDKIIIGLGWDNLMKIIGKDDKTIVSSLDLVPAIQL